MASRTARPEQRRRDALRLWRGRGTRAWADLGALRALSRRELYERARRLKISGRARLDKAGLTVAVAAAEATEAVEREAEGRNAAEAGASEATEATEASDVPVPETTEGAETDKEAKGTETTTAAAGDATKATETSAAPESPESSVATAAPDGAEGNKKEDTPDSPEAAAAPGRRWRPRWPRRQALASTSLTVLAALSVGAVMFLTRASGSDGSEGTPVAPRVAQPPVSSATTFSDEALDLHRKLRQPDASRPEPLLPQAGYLRRAQARVYARPSRQTRVITVFRRFRADNRPTVVFAVQDKLAGDSRWWRVMVPGRPNGRYGWVSAQDVYLGLVNQRIVVDLSERRLRFFEDRRLRLSVPVAIGARGAETPKGRFYVTARYKATLPILGAYALETSAYSKLSDWPGGGIVGIHGTSEPGLIGQAVSHGCVRLRDRDILRLKALSSLGAEVMIVA